MTETPTRPDRSHRLGANRDFRDLFTAAVAARLGAHISYVAVPLSRSRRSTRPPPK